MSRKTSSGNEINIDYTPYRHLIIGFFTIVISMIFVILVDICIYLIFKDSDALNTVEVTNLFLDPLSSFKPEKVERIQFMVSLILFPLLIFTFNKLLKKKIQNTSAMILRSAVLIIIIAVFLLYYCIGVSIADNSYFFQYNIVNTNLLGFVILFIALLFVLYRERYKDIGVIERRIIEVIAYIVPIIIIITASMMCIFGISNINGHFDYNVHFSAYFYSVVQVFEGKTLLVDTFNQYGLYPHFLIFIFKLTGLSVLKFTVTMAVLLAFSNICIFIFLKNVVKSRIVFICGFASVIWTSYFYVKMAHFIPYPQYFPHRVLFPSMAILLSYLYLKNRNKMLYYLTYVISSISMLWNFETGIIVFVSWMLLMFYQEMSHNDWKKIIKNCIVHMIKGLSVLALVVGLFTLYILMISGHFPQYMLMFEYQSIFYLNGFYMLPMSLFHPWNIVVLVYIIGLFIASNAIIHKNINPKSSMIFFLSIMGTGIFTYYQGRSHDECLAAVISCCIILLTLYADELLNSIINYFRSIKSSMQRLSYENNLFYLGKLILFVTIFFYITSSLCSFTYSLPYFTSKITKNFTEIQQNPSTYVTRTSDFVKQHTNPGESICILAMNSGVYYLESQTKCFLNVPGETEILLKKDIRVIEKFLTENSNIKVFVDSNFYEINGDQKVNIRNIINENYSSQEISPDQNMKLIVKK